MIFEVRVLRGPQGTILGKVTLSPPPHKNAMIKGFLWSRKACGEEWTFELGLKE